MLLNSSKFIFSEDKFTFEHEMCSSLNGEELTLFSFRLFSYHVSSSYTTIYSTVQFVMLYRGQL